MLGEEMLKGWGTLLREVIRLLTLIVAPHQWLFWQMGGLGPMAGQNHHFLQYAPEKIPCAIERYVKETNRLYAVLNKRLADREFLAGNYSIADMARIRGSCHTPARVRISTTSPL